MVKKMKKIKILWLLTLPGSLFGPIGTVIQIIIYFFAIIISVFDYIKLII